MQAHVLCSLLHSQNSQKNKKTDSNRRNTWFSGAIVASSRGIEWTTPTLPSRSSVSSDSFADSEVGTTFICAAGAASCCEPPICVCASGGEGGWVNVLGAGLPGASARSRPLHPSYFLSFPLSLCVRLCVYIYICIYIYIYTYIHTHTNTHTQTHTHICSLPWRTCPFSTSRLYV